MSSLRINVQIDALPDQIDAAGTVTGRYVGVRLSAAIVPDAAGRAVSGDLPALLPWQWLDSRGNPWDSSLPTSWQAWMPTNGAPLGPKPTPQIIFRSDAKRQPPNPATGDDGLRPAKFAAACQLAAQAFCNAPFDPSQLEWSAAANTATGLCGFVESLSTLPAPLSEAMQVFTVFRVPDDANAASLVVVPVFHVGPGAAAVAYTAATLPTVAASGWSVDYTPTPAAAMAANAQVSRVNVARTPEARILLEDDFLVAGAQEAWSAVVREDWMTPLPRRIAALLDPLKCLSEGLEQAIQALVREVPAASPIVTAFQTRPAMAGGSGLAPTDTQLTSLLDYLAVLAWRLLAPSAAATLAMTQLPPAILRGQLAPRGQVGPGAPQPATLLQALAAWSLRDACRADPGATLPGLDATPSVTISVWSMDRLRRLFGAPTTDNPDGDNGSEILGQGQLRRWLIAHLAQPASMTTPAPLPTAVTLLQTAGVAWSNRRVPDALACYGLLDLRRFRNAAAADAISIAIDVAVAAPEPGAALTIRLLAETTGTVLAAVTTAAIPDTAGVTTSVHLTITPGAPGTPTTFSATLLGATVTAPAMDPAWCNSRAMITLQIAPDAGMTVRAVPPPEGVIDQMLGNLSETVLRDNAAQLFAAPAMPMVLSGQTPDGGLARPGPSSPVEAMRAALPFFIGRLLTDEHEAARNLAQNTADSGVAALLTSAVALAIANATASATSLFDGVATTAAASTTATFTASDYALTPKSAPLVVPIDQPQPFAGDDDLWLKFSGAGVLVGTIATRTPPDDVVAWAPGATGANPSEVVWQSLNAAEMHLLAGSADGIIHYDADDTLLRPAAGTPYFDPVPAQIAEIGGVRAASITYENRGLVGVMPHDPAHYENNPQTSQRRIEAYSFPWTPGDPGQAPRGGATLPALTFGRTYQFLPYLIGHGGSLPAALWDDGTADRRPTRLARRTDKSIAVDLALLRNTLRARPTPLSCADVVRQTPYLRATPVGEPRLRNAADLANGVPDGVFPLAAELPVQAAPITLLPGETAFFYCTSARNEGLLNFTATAAGERALEICFPALPAPAGGVAATLPCAYELTLMGRGGSATPGDDSVGQLFDAIPLDGRPGRDLGAGATIRIALTQSVIVGSIAPVSKPGAMAALGSWRDMFVCVKNIAPPGAASVPAWFTPPVASLGVWDSKAGDFTIYRLVPPPEAVHQKRQIKIIDGIDSPGRPPPTLALQIRRPSTDFATYERWINWDPKINTRLLDDAHSLVTFIPKKTDDPKLYDLTLDDPAVARIAVEAVRIFPGPAVTYGIRFLARSWAPADKAFRMPGSRADPDVAAFSIDLDKTQEAFVLDDHEASAAKGFSVVPGGVYEFRIHGAVPFDTQTGIAAKPPQRFAKGAWQGLRQTTDAKLAYRLGAPLTLTVEVTTAEMPVFFGAPVFQASRVATDTGDTATIGFLDSYVTGVTGSYASLKRISHIALLSQRWAWRGQPLPSPPDATRLSDPPAPGNRIEMRSIATTAYKSGTGAALGSAAHDFGAIAFADRRPDDIGVIEEIRLGDSHIHIQPPSVPQLAPLFEKNLQYAGGAHWWRFALRATSRYAAMRPDMKLVCYTHRGTDPNDGERWQSLLVTDRDTGRAIKRPALMLVLPLSESAMSDTAVPPLLALFSEPMFAGFNIGDGIEVALSYARHPLANAPQRYWPQIGPDPILTGRGHSGRPVPLRLDGPLGYTFDIGTEAPHFGRSGWLVTPLSQEAEAGPWTFACLQFRRLEAIETSSNVAIATRDAAGPIELQITAPSGASPAIQPPGMHEGIVIDFGALDMERTATLQIKGGPRLPTYKVGQFTLTVDGPIATAPDMWRIGFDTDLGSAGSTSIQFRASTKGALRLVLSQRDPPGTSAAPYEPVLDVSVRIFIDDGEAEGLVRTLAGSWLTVACVPVLAGAAAFLPGDHVCVTLDVTPAVPCPQAAGVRLSSFTPPVWCQFAQDSSRFAVASAPAAVPVAVSFLDMQVMSDGGLYLAMRDDGTRIETLSWLPPMPDPVPAPVLPDPPSQILGEVALVITRYVTDAINQLREAPVAIFRFADGTFDTAAPMWREAGDSTPPASIDLSRKGRARLMTLMRRNVARSAGPPLLADYFGPIDDIAMSGDDAFGRIVGISKPIDFP